MVASLAVKGAMLGGVSASIPKTVAEGGHPSAPDEVKVGVEVSKHVYEKVSRDMFPKDFVFGTATAAYQVEGAHNEGGRGLSIWDVFSKKTGKTAQGHTGDVACDQYHRYEEDAQLMVDMGVDAYRFSISWPRLFPDGRGKLNPEGVAYYNRLIDCLLERGIQPYVTLYHWDLPQALHQQFGGWLDPQIVQCFEEYADTCFSAFGDRVKHWITFNEPLTFASCGYGHGVHAPGRGSDASRCEDGGDSSTEPYTVGHHILLSHAAAVDVYRRKYRDQQGGVVGITVDSDWSEPISEDPADVAAAQRRMEFQLGWMLDPLYTGDYPPIMRDHVGSRLPPFTREQAALLRGSTDFVGLNHYTSRWVAHDAAAAAGAAAGKKASGMFADQCASCTVVRDGVQIGPRAASEWLYVVPWGLKKALLWLTRRYDRPVILADGELNGQLLLLHFSKQQLFYFLFSTFKYAGMDDEDDSSLKLEEALDDSQRVKYYNDYVFNIASAMNEGADVRGYFAWSLLDNFEWAMGYTRRFGLHYVDYNDNLKRYPKKSAKWWAEFLKA
eukprot:jgi/Mesen1/9971/ME000072S09382